MCGRYVSKAERGPLLELYDATPVGHELAPSYNVAPTTLVYGVVEHQTKTGEVERQLRNLKWGR